MKNVKNIAVLFLALAVMACGSQEAKTDESETKVVSLENLNLDNLHKEISKREELLRQDSIRPDRQKAIDLMQAYIVYQRRFNNRDKSAEYLFKAGEIAMGLNMTSEAIRCLDKVYNEYSRYEKRPYALFLKAFVLENQAKNYDEAKLAYELFIEEFPGHEMADDAEYSLKNMGKTPEQLIREFEIQDSIRKANGAV